MEFAQQKVDIMAEIKQGRQQAEVEIHDGLDPDYIGMSNLGKVIWFLLIIVPLWKTISR